MSRRPFGNGVVHTPTRDRMRQRMFDKQSGLCWLCGKPMTLARKVNGNIGNTFATFDHKKPRSDGGTNHYANLALAHRKCNNSRGSRPVLA